MIIGKNTRAIPHSINQSITQSSDPLKDVASRTFFAKHHTIFRHSSCLCCCFMSVLYLVPTALFGLPLLLLPATYASSMCFSSDSWRLMCPKYLPFSLLISRSSVIESILTFSNIFFICYPICPWYSQDFSVAFHLKNCNKFAVCFIDGPCFTSVGCRRNRI